MSAIKWQVTINGVTKYTTAPTKEKAISNVRFKVLGRRPLHSTDHVICKTA